MSAQLSPTAAPVLLEVHDLAKSFPGGGARRQGVQALAGVSFSVHTGETVALVGESGSGKSTIGRILLRLERADRGLVHLAGEPVAVTGGRRPSPRYRQQVQMVFQDPLSSLNGLHTVRHHLERPLLAHGRVDRARIGAKVRGLLADVGLGDAPELLDRHPHELSGGQRQRVALARALAPEPRLLVADEPTSMLDVSVRLGVLKLLAQLQRERGLSILFITHDLATARFLARRVIVLYAGQIMEVGRAAELVSRPAHPYTRLLLAATPVGFAGRGDARRALPSRLGDVAALAPGGCPFRARCPQATAVCERPAPVVRLDQDHLVRCHHA